MSNVSKNWFAISAGCILMVTGVAKIVSAFGTAKVLAVENPLLGLKFGHLMFAVGGIELAVAAVCFFGRSVLLAVGFVSWLATSFLFYRVAFAWMGYRMPCSCLGNLSDAVHVKPESADMSMKIILAYLLIGSYSSLFWFLRPRKQTTALVGT